MRGLPGANASSRRVAAVALLLCCLAFVPPAASDSVKDTTPVTTSGLTSRTLQDAQLSSSTSSGVPSSTTCTENARAEFTNSRGEQRNCDWISRLTIRAEEECSLDQPPNVVVTKADGVCPVSCGKCASQQQTVQEGDNETTLGNEEIVFDANIDLASTTTTDKNQDSQTIHDGIDEGTTSDPADTAETMAATRPSGIKFAGLLDQQDANENEAAVAQANDEATTRKPRPGRPSVLPKAMQRRWTDTAFTVISDPMQYLESSPSLERDPFFFTDHPSMMPSESPTAIPSASPSISPSSSPTETYPQNPLPDKISSSYFDYRPGKSAKRGPENWDNVDDPPEGRYWKEEFGQYVAPSLGKNRCDSKSRRQSPIDLRFADSKGQCFEYHGIRPKPGIYNIDDPKVTTKILPSKLRIIYPPNFGSDWGGASENDQVKGPSADIPKGWGHQLPVTHVDIKIPSEHWMEGKQYAAEYQINVIQNRDSQRGAPVISVLFDFHPDDTPNFRIQQLLDHFQAQYDADKVACEAKQRQQRKLSARLRLRGKADESTWLDEPAEEEAKFQEYRRRVEEQPLYRKFNVWDPEWILVTTWFFGYEGSLTEPPCTEFLEWRIMDKPALISKDQLVQMKKILLNHVDKSCKRTSVHYQGSVARPLQPYSGRLVHRCMCRDFLGDDDRKTYGSNRCAWVERDKFGFDRDQYTLEWYKKTHKYEDPSDQPLTDWASF